MSKPDLTYSRSGMFVAFLPETAAGAEAWCEIARHTDETCKVPYWQLASTLAQLRAAGFSVRRAPRSKPMTNAEVDALLAELDA